ncbi:NTP transferase domain-containing protein [Actinocorallia longicatena]|uniref:MobA-like NTP transferase domain-containing protein n=1 Tax=Actinocorallia longicatena TaxID=111803 RepID=A0ABP6QDS0_9ACTN
MPAERGTCAVIPAAGRGTRLGLGVPKILVEVVEGVTVWDLLYRRLAGRVDHVHVVLSPEGEPLFRERAAAPIGTGRVSVSVQPEPDGMGGAIFGAAPFWSGHADILVVWGDQANLSEETVRRVLEAPPAGLVLPLVPMADPYVEYETEGERLLAVRQSREGEPTRPGGLSDVGVFRLGTRGLERAWRDYLAEAAPGALTGEVNFLPFLPWLSGLPGRPVRVVEVTDPEEARGINTEADLEFVRRAHLR